jgi:RNA polymerase sigma factor (sigma-70 family)
LPDREQTSVQVRRAQQGDAEAFAAIVRAYQDIAVAYATAILGDYHLAEDAAQDALVDAYRLLPSLRDPAAFGAWLRTIVFKHCDRLTRRQQPRLTGLDAALDVASSEPSPLAVLEARDARHALRTAIATLTAAEQEVVLLYYMGEHSHGAIAEFLDVTPNTVKTRLYAARQRLRAHLTDVALTDIVLTDIDTKLRAARPSMVPAFAARVQRMIQPDILKQHAPLTWSSGMGPDVWDMLSASAAGDLESVTRLLSRDPSLVRSHYIYRRPLYFAVRENHLDVARLLLAHGADPTGSVASDSPLEMARDRGYDEMRRLIESAIAGKPGEAPRGGPIAAAIRAYDVAEVRRLLDAAPDLVHAGDEGTSQPIHWATMTRQLDLIDDLLARGADINARRRGGAQPIHLCGGDYDYRGYRDVPAHVTTTPGQVYLHLVARGADVDMTMAAATGDLARVRALLDRDPATANQLSHYDGCYVGSGSPLKNAASGGHLEVVTLLLAHGADPNLPEEGVAPHGHALYEAVWHRHYDIAKLLLEHGAYPNPEVESCGDTLSIAMSRKDQPMIELLRSYGAAPDVGLLAYEGDLQPAEAIFAENPALANDPRLLANAAVGGHEAFVRLLLRHQPDLATRIDLDHHWTVGPKTRALTELLFASGMNPSQSDWLRVTPLHHFAGRGDLEKATLYLDHGADLHAIDEDLRSTPLGWAAKFGQLAMVELLLRRGANPHLPADPPWATPLAWATRRGHHAIVDLLTAHMR